MNTITSTPLRTLIAGAILSVLAFSFATVSSANDGTTPPQVIVKFGDLDISTSKGAAALYDRIQTAAVMSARDLSTLGTSSPWRTGRNASIRRFLIR